MYGRIMNEARSSMMALGGEIRGFFGQSGQCVFYCCCEDLHTLVGNSQALWSPQHLAMLLSAKLAT